MMRKSSSYSSLQKIGYNEDYEEEEGFTEEDPNEQQQSSSFGRQESYSILRWPEVKAKGKKPFINFAAACVLIGTPDTCLESIKKYSLGYKFVKTECKLVRNILASHGFKETTQNSVQFNIMWTGSHLKPYTLRALTEHQKVNHFPRSYELTRKDRLYKNIQRMQHAKGVRHFDFIPQSFILPTELNDFYAAFLKDRGPWIVKPCASSRGRGIYLINHPSQIPMDENVLVCRYIDNPLLINDYKFDCRIYVAVSSYDPLRIYIYEEGLARFSTVKYEKGSSKNLQNQWMHLTNYSLNKFNDDYVRCEDPEIDDYGSKWSFSAMLRYLKEVGKDTRVLMARIEDVIIKTIISGEMAIATACKMFVPFSGNCFELFGFDILIDENLKPWLLEVNLSPSLACDAPMDLKIKANLICDLFNLTGISAENPTVRRPPRIVGESRKKQRHASSSYSSTDLKNMVTKTLSKKKDDLTNEERRLLWETKEEFHRRGFFIRVYPSPESWELYSSLQDHQTSHNRMIHSKLFPQLWCSTQRPQSATYIARARNLSSLNKPLFNPDAEIDVYAQNFHSRYLQYERKLTEWSTFSDKQFSEDEGIQSLQKENLAQGQLSKSSLSTQQNEPATSIDKYEGKLLKHEESRFNTISVPDVVQKGKDLSKLQAREAFSVYLQRVQHRLLQEISFSQGDLSTDRLTPEEMKKQEHQITLIHKFLQKASVNLSTPLTIIIPHEHLNLLDRKKILARQLNDFIRIYNRETHLLSELDDDNNKTESQQAETDNMIPHKSFNTFIAIASETELEELLTIYTRHNKSASIFLGAKPAKKFESNRSGSRIVTRPPIPEHKEKSSDFLARPKQCQSPMLRNQMSAESCSQVTESPPSSRYSQRSSNRHQRHSSEPNTRIQTSKTRPYSAVTTDIIDNKRHPTRQFSAGNTRRRHLGQMHTSKRLEQKMSAICAYTSSNDLLRYQQRHRSLSVNSDQQYSRPSTSERKEIHVYGADNPELKDALKDFSERRSNRTYGTNSRNASTTVKRSKSTEKLIERQRITGDFPKSMLRSYAEENSKDKRHREYQEFLSTHRNKFKSDRKADFDIYGIDKTSLEQWKTTNALQSESDAESSVHSNGRKSNKPPVYNQPTPPKERKPSIRKQLVSQRMSRIVRRK